MIEPLVTIIMPARNVEQYIRDAIRSVLAQSYAHWELIVIENDSMDKTALAVQEFIDPRIKLIRTQLPGLSHARNIGLKMAQGEFICFLDADDILPGKSIASRVKLMQQHPEVMFADGKVNVFNHDLSQLRYVWTPTYRGNPHHEMALLNPGCFSGITWMIRRVAIGNNVFDTTWTHLEDRLFFLSISQQGLYDHVDEIIYSIRRRPGSLMANLRALERAYKRFMQHVFELKLYDNRTRIKEEKQFHRMFYRTYLKHLQPVKASWHLIKRMRKKSRD